MPGREYAAAGSYRYGFNGKENDNEVKGEGNQQDYGMRIYDLRLGRFLSIAPLFKEYPWYTPYQFAGNRPILAIDIDGMEPCDNPWAHSRGITNHQCHIPWQGWKKELSQQFIVAAPFVGGIVAGAYIGSLAVTAVITNITAQAAITYSTYSVAAANAGAFVIELLNPDLTVLQV